MGKVKDEAPAKASKPAAKGSSALRSARQSIGPFLANLVKTDVVKPTQGKQARLWTAVGLGALVLAGLYQLHEVYLKGQYSALTRFSIPTVLALFFGWIIFRIVQYPPFADFLIATEAEMNKVSWTSKADLYRATTVVLVTVLLLAVYLFGVDLLWSKLLQLMGVLRTADTSGFGSQAG